jgi:ATP-dependent RNA helicase RhlE
LIFAATKSLADQLYDKLIELFPDIVGVIHSNKEQNYRFNTVNQFKAGVFKYIISTDVMARGIDVAEVTHVINFDTPDVPENYIHRIGRSGRFGRKGVAINFITKNDIAQLKDIETFYLTQIEEMPQENENEEGEQ